MKITDIIQERKVDNLDEGWKDQLFGLGLAGAVAAGSTGVMTAKQALTSPNQTKPAAAVAQNTQPSKPQLKTAQPTAPAKVVEPTVNYITNTPLEKYLMTYAAKAGLRGYELAQFMAQCAHETQDFSRLAERGSPQYFRKYEPKYAPKKAKILGNTKVGDGARFKGRGFIQLTGRYNYGVAGKAIGKDLIKNPQLAENPKIAAQIALWYWQNRVKPSVDDYKNTTDVTRKINPGLKGLEDRHENFIEYIAGDETDNKNVNEQDLFPSEFATKRTTVPITRTVSSKGTQQTFKLPNINSQGRIISSVKQSLQNFWNWFGDSKAVDSKGRPIVFFHGTNSDFSEFKTHIKTYNSYGLLGIVEVVRSAIFVTPEKSFAHNYVRDEMAGANIISVYVRSENPFDLRNGLSSDQWQELEQAGYNPKFIHQALDIWEIFDDPNGDHFVNTMKKLGYDSVLINEEGVDVWALFSSTQIKAVYGNKGTYDSSGNIVKERVNEFLKQGVTEGLEQEFEFELDTEKGRLNVYNQYGGPAGRIEFYPTNSKTINIDLIIVQPQYQRKGLGTQMFNYLKDRGYTIKRPTELTPDGKKFFGNLIQKGMAEDQTEDDNITVQNNVETSFRGGYGGTLIAKTPERQVGYLNYSIYNDKPQIGMIFVAQDYRRRGVAMKMLKALQELSPNEEIDWGITTDAGSNLRKSINYRKVPNPEIIKKKAKLAGVRSKLARLNYRLEQLKNTDVELARKFIKTVGDRWNQLNDLEYKLENELYLNKGEYSKLIPEEVNGLYEKWSQKYKRSINCNNPKGFSQRAHCQGRKKNEDTVLERKRKRSRKKAYGFYGYYPIYSSSEAGAEGGGEGG